MSEEIDEDDDIKKEVTTFEHTWPLKIAKMILAHCLM